MVLTPPSIKDVGAKPNSPVEWFPEEMPANGADCESWPTENGLNYRETTTVKT